MNWNKEYEDMNLKPIPVELKAGVEERIKLINPNRDNANIKQSDIFCVSENCQCEKVHIDKNLLA